MGVYIYIYIYIYELAVYIYIMVNYAKVQIEALGRLTLIKFILCHVMLP